MTATTTLPAPTNLIDNRTARMALASLGLAAQDRAIRYTVNIHGAPAAWAALCEQDTGLGHAARKLDLDRMLAETADLAGVRFAIPGDHEYPLPHFEVDHEYGAPYGLWIKGEMIDTANLAVTVTGARACTGYGGTVASAMGHEIAEGCATLVTGLGFGIDVEAHRGALAADSAQTIAVLPAGIDNIYPSAHAGVTLAILRRGGTLVSEYAPGASPSRKAFMARARIMAGLSDAVVIVEASVRSAAKETANWAELLGHRLCAVPGPVTSMLSETPHRLIQEGRAKLVTSAAEVMEGL